MRCGRGLDLIEMDRGNGRDYGKGAWLGYKGAGSAGKEAWLEDQWALIGMNGWNERDCGKGAWPNLNRKEREG